LLACSTTAQVNPVFAAFKEITGVASFSATLLEEATGLEDGVALEEAVGDEGTADDVVALEEAPALEADADDAADEEVFDPQPARTIMELRARIRRWFFFMLTFPRTRRFFQISSGPKR
jgi:hypothetical protein